MTANNTMGSKTDDEPASVVKGREEMEFVDRFATALAEGKTDSDRGRVKQERKAADESTEDDTDQAESTKGNSKSGKSRAGGTQDDESEVESEDDDEEENAEGASEDDKDEDDEESDEEDEEKGKKKDEDDDEDDEDEEAEKDKDDDEDDDDPESEEESLAKEAQAALKKHGLTLTLKDVPKEYRPIVEKQLAAVTASYTRAMMEARAYRADEAKSKAERKFQKEHPALYIAEIIEKGGEELEKQVNELLNGATDEKGKKLLQVDISDKRNQIVADIDKEAKATEAGLKRADEIEVYVKTACTKLGLDFDTVADSVINAINDKPANAKDLTPKEIDAIIGRHDRVKRKLLGQKKVNDKKAAIQGRTRDKKVVSPAARGGSGTAPSPTGKKPPQNDEEFAVHMAGKLAGSRRASR